MQSQRTSTALIALAGLTLGLLGLAPPRPAHAATIFTVTTTADLPAPCTASAFSLRCAFTQANADGSGDTIAFHIPSTDPGCVRTVIQQTTVPVCTISPTHAHGGSLPVLFVNNTTIDGYTQPGARPNTLPAGQGDNAILTIQLDGTKGGTFLLDGIELIGVGNTVRGLSVTNFFEGTGIHLGSMFAGTPLDAHDTVAGNFLGLAPDGHTGGNSINNVMLDVSTGSDTIGGTSAADANVIGGGVKRLGIANLAGVYISAGAGTPGAGANDVIEGNYIGTNPAGTAALGNGVGIRDAGGTSLTVGGTSPGARNVISGNTLNGVEADAAGSFGGVIDGNFIGTNGAGTAALGNGPVGFQNGNGVMISGPGAFIVGRSSAAAHNVISGNANAGIAIPNGSINNIVEGNLIGTNAAGTAALGNGNGIAFPQDSPFAGPSVNNAIEDNLISGNTADGIAEQSPSTQNLFERNIIGLSIRGAQLGNGGNGIDLTLHGGLLSGSIEDVVAGNIIMHNAQSGVLVGALAHSQITQNSMAANGGLGIDLAPQGVVNCDTPPPGPNDNTPCPVITIATTTTVSGTACGGCTVEVFIASAKADDQGHGEGQTFLGSAVADATSGAWSLALASGQVHSGAQVTASATTVPSHSTPAETSEFGANVAVAP